MSRHTTHVCTDIPSDSTSLVQGRRSYVFFWVRTHPLFRSWVRIGIGPTHFSRRIVYYCVCIQHDIDKSQISFIELCKTLRTNSGLRAINSCLHLFWPHLCKACWVNVVLWQQNLKFSLHQQTVEFWTHPHFYTDLYAPALVYTFKCHRGGMRAGVIEIHRRAPCRWATVCMQTRPATMHAIYQGEEGDRKMIAGRAVGSIVQIQCSHGLSGTR